MLETQFTEIQTQPQGLNSLNNELYRQHEFCMFPYAVNFINHCRHITVFIFLIAYNLIFFGKNLD